MQVNLLLHMSQIMTSIGPAPKFLLTFSEFWDGPVKDILLSMICNTMS